MRLTRIALTLLAVLGCAAAVHGQAGGKKDWAPVSQTKIISESFDLRGFYGWQHDPIMLPSRSTKAFLSTRAAASDPDRVFFALMDGENFERMRAGYPPILIAATPIARAGEIEIPYNVPYWYGFIEITSKPASAGSIPTNTLGAAIWLLNAYQRQNHPSIRMTAEIYSVLKVAPAGSGVLRPADPAKPAAPAASGSPRMIDVLHSIAASVPTYCHTYLRAPDSMADLESARLFDSATERVPGYAFTVHALNCGLWGAVVIPVKGKGASFYLDEVGRLHKTISNRAATRDDPVVPNP